MFDHVIVYIIINDLYGIQESKLRKLHDTR